MIPDFELLAEKVEQLAHLTQTLRQENASLRIENIELKRENKKLQENMAMASSRVSALLETIPSISTQEEKDLNNDAD